MILDLFGTLLILPIAFFITKYGRFMHKHETKFYLGALFISIIATFFSLTKDQFGFNLNVPILYQLLFMGHLSFALFTVVMFGGAFKNKSKPKIVIMQVRRELAILGFIFLMPHANYKMALVLGGYNYTGFIAMLIMVPLVLTSFPKIRSKMHPKTWKNIHKLAYIAYFMIYIHVAFTLFTVSGFYLFKPSPYSVIYHLIFGIYLIMKIQSTLQNKKCLKVKKLS